LRTNRALLSLSLANNNIGDEGARAFADVLSRFQMTHEEIVHRRNIISGRTDIEKSVIYVSPFYVIVLIFISIFSIFFTN
jgi:hypothetical protein